MRVQIVRLEQPEKEAPALRFVQGSATVFPNWIITGLTTYGKKTSNPMITRSSYDDALTMRTCLELLKPSPVQLSGSFSTKLTVFFSSSSV